MKIDADVALEIAHHESVIRQAYRDSVNVWTWSVGLTSKCGHRVRRYIDNPQPLDHCLAVYAWALRNYADEVEDAFEGHTVSKEQFTAALSFHWNTGGIARASWVRRWKAGDNAAARKSFMAWNKPSSIVKRRRKERDLFFDGKWSNNGTMTEFTRVTHSHRPDWSSAVKVDVTEALERALA